MSSIISYAGLDLNTLLSEASRLFAHGDLPRRFRMFLPLFPSELVVDMPYERGQFVADDLSYHRVLFERIPRLYQGDNALRCLDKDGQFAGGVVTVDQSWVKLFAQYQPFVGERLFVHMIGGGHQAVPVPESLFPRAGRLIANAERDMGIEQRCQHFSAWLKTQLENGAPYDMDVLEAQYLAMENIEPVSIRQRDLGRVMQEISIAYELEHAAAPAGLYTETSKQSEGIPQYVPFLCACDYFEPTPVTRATARLVQLYFEGDGRVRDLWLPYEEASAFIDKRRMTVDMRALCESFQIAPACDRQQRGGVYPDRVRVAVVRDRSLPLMAAETINNPAYGSGMNPQGTLSHLIYLPDSAKLLERGQLGAEQHNLTIKNDRVDEADYLHMRALAEWQEHKGRLIDAMYRRENALRQFVPGSGAYERAKDMLDLKVNRYRRMAHDEPKSHGQRSGYDAEIAYLEHKAATRKDVRFIPDEEREKRIESGYAMRQFVQAYSLEELSGKQEKPVPAKAGKRQQAANGQWYEQVSMFS